MKIIIYSFDRDEMDLYAHYAEAQLGAHVLKCYDSFTLRRNMPGAHCAVLIRNSANTQTNHKTSTLISAMRKYKVREVPILLVDLRGSITYEVGADKVISGLHPMGDFIDAILEVTGKEVAA